MPTTSRRDGASWPRTERATFHAAAAAPAEVAWENRRLESVSDGSGRVAMRRIVGVPPFHETESGFSSALFRETRGLGSEGDATRRICHAPGDRSHALPASVWVSEEMSKGLWWVVWRRVGCPPARFCGRARSLTASATGRFEGGYGGDPSPLADPRSRLKRSDPPFVAE